MEAFVRKIDAGQQQLSLSLYDYNPIFEFSLSLCIRLNPVQEIVNRFSGSPPAYHGQTLTSVTQLEFLGIPAEPGRGVRYRVRGKSDLHDTLPHILQLVQHRVIPFFDQYRSIDAVNRGLNPIGAEDLRDTPSSPDRRSFDATNMPCRAITGVAAAYLAKDPRLPLLATAYRRQLRGARAEDLRRFDDLLAYLGLPLDTDG